MDNLNDIIREHLMEQATKQPFEYPLVKSFDGINIHALPDFLYFVSFEGRSCYVRFAGAGFLWIDPWLNAETCNEIEIAILHHELLGVK